MRNLYGVVLILLMLVFLSSCSASYKSNVGKGAKDFKSDDIECEKEAIISVYGPDSSCPSGRINRSGGSSYGKCQHDERNDAIYRSCLKRKGWISE